MIKTGVAMARPTAVKAAPQGLTDLTSLGMGNFSREMTRFLRSFAFAFTLCMCLCLCASDLCSTCVPAAQRSKKEAGPLAPDGDLSQREVAEN